MKKIFCIVMVLFATVVFAQKKLVVFITGYNNVAWIEKTLDSIFSQRYQNFRVLYIDDASSDGAATVVKDYIAKHALSDRVTFIVNETRRCKMANLYRGFYLCQDNEIVVFIDGDDWILHDRVFEKIVETYKDSNVWMTYGSYCNVPKTEADAWRVNRKGSCNYIPQAVLEKKTYRKHTFIFMHLRTCYGWLLKQIKLTDLIARRVKGFIGDFYPASNDLATFFPVVEMAHTHVEYIPETLYVRNLYSDIVGFKVDRTSQVSSAFEIRKKQSYTMCKNPIVRNLDQYKQCKADIIIQLNNDCHDITQSIANIEAHLIGYDHIFVLYDRCLIEKEYARSVADKKNKIIPVGYYSDRKNSYKDALHIILQHTKNHYIVWVDTAHTWLHEIDCAEHIYWLERTFADITICSTDKMPAKKIMLTDRVSACLSEGCIDIHAGVLLVRKKDCASLLNKDALCLYISEAQ